MPTRVCARRQASGVPGVLDHRGAGSGRTRGARRSQRAPEGGHENRRGPTAATVSPSDPTGLADQALSLGEVADQLGYTELSNFVCAFGKWTGTTPAAYRARQVVVAPAAYRARQVVVAPRKTRPG